MGARSLIGSGATLSEQVYTGTTWLGGLTQGPGGVTITGDLTLHDQEWSAGDVYTAATSSPAGTLSIQRYGPLRWLTWGSDSPHPTSGTQYIMTGIVPAADRPVRTTELAGDGGGERDVNGQVLSNGTIQLRTTYSGVVGVTLTGFYMVAF